MGLDANELKAIGTGTSIVGGITQASGEYDLSRSYSDRYLYQAAVLRNNALIADEAAEVAIQRGQEETQVRQIKTAQTVGEQRANLAANGVVVDQDTAIEAIVDTARIGKMDEATIQKNAAREALALKMQGQNFTNQAQLSDRAAADSRKAGKISALSTLLTTASNVALKWNK